jgi:serine/alanine adding enzyme
MVRIISANDEDEARWDAYLDERAIYHHAYRFRWKRIIQKVFGHRGHYLIAEKDGAVCGLLPLIRFKSALFGTSLVSVPFLNGGGAVADDPETMAALIDQARAVAAEENVDYVELRHRALADWSAPAFGNQKIEHRSHKAAMLLSLPTDAEALFTSFPPKLRSQIRRPSKDGAFCEVSKTGDSSPATIDSFYSVFSEHMRDLGTPVYPKALFKQTVEAFKDSARVIIVRKDNVAVAAGITIGFGDYLEIPWASALKRYSKSAPNMLLYWDAIKTAIEDKYKTFDFGRSSLGTGTYKFKEQWGSQPLPLHWYYLVEKGSVPDVNPHSPKFELLTSCWKKLPLKVANMLGPWITRSLP